MHSDLPSPFPAGLQLWLQLLCLSVVRTRFVVDGVDPGIGRRLWEAAPVPGRQRPGRCLTLRVRV
jgi:hypothetical protein